MIFVKNGTITTMRKRSELLISLIQIPVDYIMLVVSFTLAYFLRQGSGKPFSGIISGYAYLDLVMLFLPIWLIIFAGAGLYRIRSDRGNWVDIGKIFVACAAGVMVLIVIDFLSPSPIFPAKIVPIYGFVLSVVLVSLGRLIMTLIQRTLALRGIGVYRVLFIGSGRNAVELKSTLKQFKRRYQVVSSISSLSEVSTSKLSNIISLKHVDIIMVADPSTNEENLLEILAFCQQNHIGYQFSPTISGLYTSNILSTQIGSIPILELRPTPLEGWGRILKRLFDLIVTLIIIIPVLPVLALLYLIIKATDPGPAIYSHECFGRTGNKINVYKLRTMKAEFSIGPKFAGRTIQEVLKLLPKDKADEYRATAKIKDDPRVGRFGRFLRRTSLDELPQLFNVLKGDLSLVGPRPLPESELGLLGGKQNLARIVAIRPGITGLWQVSGRNDLEYYERVKLNLYYIDNWSLWLDIKIIFKTIWQAVIGSNGV